MTVVYAVVLAVGFVALLIWIAQTAIADTVSGWDRIDPEVRFGSRGRYAVGAAIGFGLAGMSATFAGWPVVAAIGAAVGGAAFLVAVASRYGPETGDDGGGESPG